MILQRGGQRVFSQNQLDPRFKTGLVGHWIGGGSGNTWFDRSGYRNHGTLTNGPTWILGQGGKRSALNFDNTDDYVDIGTNGLLTDSQPFSLMWWEYIYPSSGTFPMRMRLQTGTGGTGHSFGVFRSSNGTYSNLSFGKYNGGSSNVQAPNVTSIANAIGIWKHFTVVGLVGPNSGTAGDFIVYEDAVATTGLIGGAALSSQASVNRLGFDSVLSAANCILDDVRVFSRVLSQSEISVLASPSFSPVIAVPREIPKLAISTLIDFNTASNSGYQAAQSTYSWSHTCTGTNRFLAVDVEILSVPGTTVTGITYGGVAMSFIGARSTVSGAGRVECWELINPASGSNTIEVTLSASVASAGTAVSYVGVHQTLPTEAFNSNQATNVGVVDATVIISPVAFDCWIHAAIATDDASVTAGQTSRNNVTGVGGSGANEDTIDPQLLGGETMSYTNVGALATWVIAGYAIRPTTASSNVFTTATILTGGSSTLSSSVAFTPGTKTATVALSSPASTLSGSATFSPGTKTITAALSGVASTLSSSTTFSPGTKTATVSLSGNPTTLAASITHVRPTYSTTGNLLGSSSTLVGSVSFVSPVYTASVALNALGSVLSASTSFVVPSYTITASLVSDSSTLSASVQFTGSVIGSRLLNMRRRVMAL